MAAIDPIERWLPVSGYEGLYSVSDQGRVRRDKGGRDAVERILKGRTHRSGYTTVRLYLGGSFRDVQAHKLVLAAHVGPRPAGMQTRHLDGHKTNNRLANLAYGTAQENSDDIERHGTRPKGNRHGRHTRPDRTARGDRHGSVTHPERLARGERHGSQTHPESLPRGAEHSKAKLTDQLVRIIRARFALGESVSGIARDLGVARSTAQRVRDGRTWAHVR